MWWKQHYPLVATTLSQIETKLSAGGNNTIPNGTYRQQRYPPPKKAETTLSVKIIFVKSKIHFHWQ